MNQKNYQYLTESLAKLGFGDAMNDSLKTKMELGIKDFDLKAKAKYGNDEMVYSLKFERKEDGEFYFLNKYKATLNKENTQPVTQEFLLYKQKGYSARQAYNLLEKRAVYRVFRKEGETIGRWSRLDFNNINESGNAMIRSYYDNTSDFNLAKELSKLPITQMSQAEKEDLMKSLQDGEKVAINITKNGVKEKVHVEVAPHLGSLMLYNNDMQKISVTNKNSMELVPDEKVIQVNSIEKPNGLQKENEKVPDTTKQLMNKINNTSDERLLKKKLS